MFLLIFLSSLFCQNAKFSLVSVVVFLFFVLRQILEEGHCKGRQDRHFQAWGALFLKPE